MNRSDRTSNNVSNRGNDMGNPQDNGQPPLKRIRMGPNNHIQSNSSGGVPQQGGGPGGHGGGSYGNHPHQNQGHPHHGHMVNYGAPQNPNQQQFNQQQRY